MQRGDRCERPIAHICWMPFLSPTIRSGQQWITRGAGICCCRSLKRLTRRPPRPMAFVQQWLGTKVQDAEPADYLDLVCLSDDASATFAAVAADIGTEAGLVPQSGRVAVVAAALSRWQWFWGIDTGSLSEQEALGLFGELWFLHRWAGDAAKAVDAWTASAGSRHDFQWPEHSVEVKATSRRVAGAILHRIEHLDQLSDPEQGQLFLFSLRIVRDQLAQNTLPSLVDHVTQDLRGNPRAGDEFARKLGQRGYSPAHRNRYEVPYRMLGEYLYSVEPGFPRLTTASFGGSPPAGITDVSYVLDMAACDPWLRAKSPEEWKSD